MDPRQNRRDISARRSAVCYIPVPGGGSPPRHWPVVRVSRRRQSRFPHLVHSAHLSRSGISTSRQSCSPIRQRQSFAIAHSPGSRTSLTAQGPYRVSTARAPTPPAASRAAAPGDRRTSRRLPSARGRRRREGQDDHGSPSLPSLYVLAIVSLGIRPCIGQLSRHAAATATAARAAACTRPTGSPAPGSAPPGAPGRAPARPPPAGSHTASSSRRSAPVPTRARAGSAPDNTTTRDAAPP